MPAMPPAEPPGLPAHSLYVVGPEPVGLCWVSCFSPTAPVPHPLVGLDMALAHDLCQHARSNSKDEVARPSKRADLGLLSRLAKRLAGLTAPWAAAPCSSCSREPRHRPTSAQAPEQAFCRAATCIAIHAGRSLLGLLHALADVVGRFLGPRPISMLRRTLRLPRRLRHVALEDALPQHHLILDVRRCAGETHVLRALVVVLVQHVCCWPSANASCDPATRSVLSSKNGRSAPPASGAAPSAAELAPLSGVTLRRSPMASLPLWASNAPTSTRSDPGGHPSDSSVPSTSSTNGSYLRPRSPHNLRRTGLRTSLEASEGATLPEPALATRIAAPPPSQLNDNATSCSPPIIECAAGAPERGHPPPSALRLPRRQRTGLPGARRIGRPRDSRLEAHDADRPSIAGARRRKRCANDKLVPTAALDGDADVRQSNGPDTQRHRLPERRRRRLRILQSSTTSGICAARALHCRTCSTRPGIPFPKIVPSPSSGSLRNRDARPSLPVLGTLPSLASALGESPERPSQTLLHCTLQESNNPVYTTCWALLLSSCNSLS